MKNSDIKTREQIRAAMQAALAGNDADAFAQAFEDMMQSVGEDIRADYEQSIENFQNERDTSVLNARGVRQLTTEEREYYQKLGGAMKDRNPKQALANLDVVMPETIIDSVFDDLQTNHPLLSKITFQPTNGAIKMLMNTNGYQTAAWGALTTEIVKELTSGFKEVDTGLMKLSAFLPVCKDMLDLGPEWLDAYVRQVLYEALANGLEAGIITGTGKDQPIGMDRQVGDDVTVSGGVYPQKAKIAVTNFRTETIGKLLGYMAVDPNGKQRQVRDVILIVNPADYFTKVMPATTIMAPDGTYRNDVLPYPITTIQSPSVEIGEAIIGMGYRYFAAAGISKDGRIEYSDDYHFLEDERVYLIKTYANGMPLDNNAFFRLDITGLEPLSYTVEQVNSTAPSDDATLSSLSLGGAALSPTFSAATTSYTATTTNNTNTVNAVAADAGAAVSIKLNGKTVANGSALTWATGSNTVEVEVVAEDGIATKTYSVSVTKE
jgi:hypothetical protein